MAQYLILTGKLIYKFFAKKQILMDISWSYGLNEVALSMNRQAHSGIDNLNAYSIFFGRNLRWKENSPTCKSYTSDIEDEILDPVSQIITNGQAYVQANPIPSVFRSTNITVNTEVEDDTDIDEEEGTPNVSVGLVELIGVMAASCVRKVWLELVCL